jgi:sterol 22-desaturase
MPARDIDPSTGLLRHGGGVVVAGSKRSLVPIRHGDEHEVVDSCSPPPSTTTASSHNTSRSSSTVSELDNTMNPGVSSSDDNPSSSNSSTTLLLERLLRESRANAERHNTPSHITSGWRRKTFHWELNFYSFIFLTGLYYFVVRHYTTARIIWHGLGLLVLIDAGRYYYQKQDLPGVPYTLPLVSLIAMLIRPVRFWAELACIAMESSTGCCTNAFGGKFMIFVTDTTLCRQVMTGEGTFQIFAHPNALWLFGDKNLIYMDTQAHKAMRAILTPALFGHEALESYRTSMYVVCGKFLERYADQCQAIGNGAAIDVRIAFRSMTVASSQEAFIGPYLTDELRVLFETDILCFTMGFLSFPFPYLNSGLHKAIQAKDRMEHVLQNIVRQAREHIQQGGAPRCLMERWCVSILAVATERGICMEDVPGCADDDMARTVLDFLFAAQDATNSALAYALDVLDEDRYVLHKLRIAVRNGDDIYVAKVANALLHHKPPVPMIPHLCKKSTTLAGRRIAGGTVVIPSITYSARTSGRSVHFDPDDTKDPDTQFVQTVVFGGGQHKCPGRRYAEALLQTFLTVIAERYDFERVEGVERPKFDQFVYFPTLFPADCHFRLRRLVEAAAAEKVPVQMTAATTDE